MLKASLFLLNYNDIEKESYGFNLSQERLHISVWNSKNYAQLLHKRPDVLVEGLKMLPDISLTESTRYMDDVVLPIFSLFAVHIRTHDDLDIDDTLQRIPASAIERLFYGSGVISPLCEEILPYISRSNNVKKFFEEGMRKLQWNFDLSYTCPLGSVLEGRVLWDILSRERSNLVLGDILETSLKRRNIDKLSQANSTLRFLQYGERMQNIWLLVYKIYPEIYLTDKLRDKNIYKQEVLFPRIFKGFGSDKETLKLLHNDTLETCVFSYFANGNNHAHFIAAFGTTENLEFLLQYSKCKETLYRVNYEGNTPLMYHVITEGNYRLPWKYMNDKRVARSIKITEELLKLGSPLSIRNKEGHNVFDLVIQYDNLVLFDILLRHLKPNVGQYIYLAKKTYNAGRTIMFAYLLLQCTDNNIYQEVMMSGFSGYYNKMEFGVDIKAIRLLSLDKAKEILFKTFNVFPPVSTCADLLASLVYSLFCRTRGRNEATYNNAIQRILLYNNLVSLLFHIQYIHAYFPSNAPLPKISYDSWLVHSNHDWLHRKAFFHTWFSHFNQNLSCQSKILKPNDIPISYASYTMRKLEKSENPIFFLKLMERHGNTKMKLWPQTVNEFMREGYVADLVHRGVPCNYYINHTSLLSMAIHHKQLNTVKALLECGADPYLFLFENTSIVQDLLVSFGDSAVTLLPQFRKNYYAFSHRIDTEPALLYYASKLKDIDLYYHGIMLKQAIAWKRYRDYDAADLVFWCINTLNIESSHDCFNELFNLNIDLHYVDKASQNTILMMAIKKFGRSGISLYPRLIGSSSSLNHENQDNQTAMSLAVQHLGDQYFTHYFLFDYDFLNLLHQKGANFVLSCELTGNPCKSLLTTAVDTYGAQAYPLVDFLIKKGALIQNVKAHSNDFLMRLFQNHYPCSFVKHMLEKYKSRIDFNARYPKGSFFMLKLINYYWTHNFNFKCIDELNLQFDSNRCYERKPLLWHLIEAKLPQHPTEVLYRVMVKNGFDLFKTNTYWNYLMIAVYYWNKDHTVLFDELVKVFDINHQTYNGISVMTIVFNNSLAVSKDNPLTVEIPNYARAILPYLSKHHVNLEAIVNGNGKRLIAYLQSKNPRLAMVFEELKSRP